MSSHCKKCHTELPAGAIECPKCKTFHPENIKSDAPKPTEVGNEAASEPVMMGMPTSLSAQTVKLKNQLDQIRLEKDSIGIDIANIVIQQVKSWFAVWKVLMIWTVVLTFGCAFLVYRIYTGTDQFVFKAVAEQLVKPTLKETVETVTDRELKRSLEANIAPSVSEFKDTVKKLGQEIQSSKTDFDRRYEELSDEVQLMNDRRHILKLTDHAMAGSHRAYRELWIYRDNSQISELTQLASGQIGLVEAYYQDKNRMLDIQVNYRDEMGKGFVDEAVPTQALIDAMLNSPHWKVRAKAANLLGSRVEIDVPDALLEAADKDPMLDVVKHALEAFSAITAYRLEGPFQVQEARRWWEDYSPTPVAGDTEVEIFEL